jgi:hypothetical protein
MNTKKTTLDRLCRLMKPETEFDPAEFDSDTDLDNQAELDRMNDIMNLIEQFKNDK